MIYCLNCGKGIPDDSKFCTFCGTPVAVVDPKQPNLATSAPAKPVDVSRNYTSTKTVNEFYKDAGFWGAILVLAGFFLPFYMNSVSLYDAVSSEASSDPWSLLWLVFPVAAVFVLVHSLTKIFPGFLVVIFSTLALITLILLAIVMIKDPVKYLGSDDISSIIKTVGLGFWATLVGTILLLFHRRHKKTIVSKTKIIDRSA